MKHIIDILMYIWQLPQNIVGLVVRLIYNHKEAKSVSKDGIRYYYSPAMRGGISLGNTVVLDARYYNDGSQTVEKHEYGHTRQSLYLGPLYLLVIGLPSLIWAAFYSGPASGYYKFCTERWADRLGGVTR